MNSPLRFASTAIALSAAILPVRAEPIRCVAAGEGDVAISPQSQRYAGRDLTCISGGFIAGLTPCAPLKAFSLSAPTGPPYRVIDITNAGHPAP